MNNVKIATIYVKSDDTYYRVFGNTAKEIQREVNSDGFVIKEYKYCANFYVESLGPKETTYGYVKSFWSAQDAIEFITNKMK